jgi:hypothetical protein
MRSRRTGRFSGRVTTNTLPIDDDSRYRSYRLLLLSYADVGFAPNSTRGLHPVSTAFREKRDVYRSADGALGAWPEIVLWP